MPEPNATASTDKLLSVVTGTFKGLSSTRAQCHLTFVTAGENSGLAERPEGVTSKLQGLQSNNLGLETSEQMQIKNWQENIQSASPKRQNQLFRFPAFKALSIIVSISQALFAV